MEEERRQNTLCTKCDDVATRMFVIKNTVACECGQVLIENGTQLPMCHCDICINYDDWRYSTMWDGPLEDNRGDEPFRSNWLIDCDKLNFSLKCPTCRRRCHSYCDYTEHAIGEDESVTNPSSS